MVAEIRIRGDALFYEGGYEVHWLASSLFFSQTAVPRAASHRYPCTSHHV